MRWSRRLRVVGGDLRFGCLLPSRRWGGKKSAFFRSLKNIEFLVKQPFSFDF